MKLIPRSEKWGVLQYDPKEHRFICKPSLDIGMSPYSSKPVVLNIDLTMKCNMDCRYCVAMDFKEKAQDLVISNKLIQWINKSDFMVVVVTGGEPLLPAYEDKLISLLKKIKRKGLIVDTNGTIYPSEKLIAAFTKTETLLRISLDSLRPQDEIYFRHARLPSPHNTKINLELYKRKFEIIGRLRRQTNINIAIQSVIHSKNARSIFNVPDLLDKYSITTWYIQRFIPSYKASDVKFGNEKYYEIVNKLSDLCSQRGIKCIIKKDRRHNSVFLLVGDGLLYTQGEKPGEKILLGSIWKQVRYFDYVSSADHAERYYENGRPGKV